FTLFYTHTTPPLSSLLPLPAALPICLYGTRIAAAPPQSPISRRYRGIAAPPSWHRACLNARSEWHHRHSRLLEGLGYAPTQLPGLVGRCGDRPGGRRLHRLDDSTRHARTPQLLGWRRYAGLLSCDRRRPDR